MKGDRIAFRYRQMVQRGEGLRLHLPRRRSRRVRALQRDPVVGLSHPRRRPSGRVRGDDRPEGRAGAGRPSRLIVRRDRGRRPPFGRPSSFSGSVPPLATTPSGTGRSGSRPSARSGSGWRAPRRAWPAADGCGRRRCGRRRSTRSPTLGESSVSRVKTLPGMRGEELEQLVLHVGQVERAARDGGLVGLEVEDEAAVLDELGPVPRPVRQNRCLSRASSSSGWNGVRQKSSKRSSRSSRSAELGPGDHAGAAVRAGGPLCAWPGRARRRPRGRRRRRRWRPPTRPPARCGRGRRWRRPATGSRRGRAPGPASGGAGSGKTRSGSMVRSVELTGAVVRGSARARTG